MIPFVAAAFMQSGAGTTTTPPPPTGGDDWDTRTTTQSPNGVINNNGTGDSFGIGSSRTTTKGSDTPPNAFSYDISQTGGDGRIYVNATSGPSASLGKNFGFSVSGLSVGERATADFSIAISAADGWTGSSHVTVSCLRTS